MKEKVKDTRDKECGWRAKLGERYYFFDEFLEVQFSWEENLEVDDIRWSVGNYFETVGEAEKTVNEAKNVLRMYHERKQ